MAGAPRRELTLADAGALIVGVIVGAGIFQVVPDVARGVSSTAGLALLWLAGGALSFCGAMVYAELAAAHPEPGGDYVYLTRAYGPLAGFLFGWLHTVVARPGDIAVMAFAFATYAAPLLRPLLGADAPPWALATGAVVVLTAVHVGGVRGGMRAQNILTAVKVGGLLLVIALAAIAPRAAAPPAAPPPLPLEVALILVLFTFGGWNEIAFVAGEVRRPERNIPRALALGLLGVTALYLLANLAFLRALGGRGGLAAAGAAAAEAVAGVLPHADRWVSALVAVSALGAVHGLIFSGARIPYAVGRDHALFRPLGVWSDRTCTPVRALVVQGTIAAVLVVALRSFLNTVMYTAAPVYLFFLATSLALPVLRRRTPARAGSRRFRGHPWTTGVFAAACAYLAWRAILYKPAVSAAALSLVAAGIPMFFASRGLAARHGGAPAPDP